MFYFHLDLYMPFLSIKCELSISYTYALAKLLKWSPPLPSILYHEGWLSTCPNDGIYLQRQRLQGNDSQSLSIRLCIHSSCWSVFWHFCIGEREMKQIGSYSSDWSFPHGQVSLCCRECQPCQQHSGEACPQRRLSLMTLVCSEFLVNVSEIAFLCVTRHERGKLVIGLPGSSSAIARYKIRWFMDCKSRSILNSRRVLVLATIDVRWEVFDN